MCYMCSCVRSLSTPLFHNGAVTCILHIHEQTYKVYTRSYCINYSTGIQIALKFNAVSAFLVKAFLQPMKLMLQVPRTSGSSFWAQVLLKSQPEILFLNYYGVPFIFFFGQKNSAS